MGRYKIALEAALSRADLVVSDDLTVLTAFTILLIVSRTLTNDRRPWTLLGLALRIAQAQGLDKEGAQPPTSIFWREMKRRVWNSLSILDYQSASDRGTEPLFTDYDRYSFSTPPPLNINDSEITPDTKGDLTDREGITDCSIPLVCRAADTMVLTLEFSASPEVS